MPELIEVERYRQLAHQCVGREIVLVRCPDPWYLKGGLAGPDVAEWLIGRSISDTYRRGKLMTVSFSDDGPTLGLRFGMTGQLIVDGVSGVGELLYSARNVDDKFNRFELGFADGGSMVMSDPRRLGGIEEGPDVDALGPEASTVSVAQLRTAIRLSKSPIKAVLMDQSRMAGLGNLLCDEILWRARINPGRGAFSLLDADLAVLQKSIVNTVRTLTKRGGSHLGDLQSSRSRAGICPRCSAPLARGTIGGRTTYWCTVEQP